MTQQTSPFLESKYGWTYGESGWNTGMDENLIKFSFLFDKNIDGIVSSLPSVINGTAYFLTTDNRIYFGVSNSWYSAPTPKWFTLVLRTTGASYQFNGASLVPISNNTDLSASIASIQVTLSSLGTAAFQPSEYFASQAALDVSSSQANAYTDTKVSTLRSDLANTIDISKGVALLGYKNRSVSAKFSDYINVKDLGAVGDGSTDDSLAFNNAVIAAQATNKSVYFPSGDYLLNTPSTLTNRIFLVGDGSVTITGNITYNCQTFPASADGTRSLLPTDPFFSAEGINFKSTNTSYALTVIAQYGVKFIDTAEIIGCKFYGSYGFLARNLISVTLTHCWFYNTIIGMRTEGCTNWSVSECYWRNCAQYGVYITSNTITGETGRKGGENIRFNLCEWAVCAIGVYLDRHMWGNYTNCLFDYCVLPFWSVGSVYTKMFGTYLGAANTAQGLPGYVAPPSTGISFFGRPYINGSNIETGGVSFTNCEMVNYVSASTQPILYIDGYNSAIPTGHYVERISIIGCKFIQAPSSHSATNLVAISYATNVSMIGNMFYSPNVSTTLAQPYNLNQCQVYQVIASDTKLCFQGSTEVRATQELIATNMISLVGTQTLVVVDGSGNRLMSLDSAGNAKFKGTVTPSTTV